MCNFKSRSASGAELADGDADDDLDQIFTWREPRKVSKSLTVRYDKILSLLEDNGQSRRAIGKYLDSWQYPDDRVELRSNGAVLPYSAYDRLAEVDQGAIIDNKGLATRWRWLN